MKTIELIQSQNEAYSTSSTTSTELEFMWKNFYNNLKIKTVSLFNRIRNAIIPTHSHTIVKIENLHKSYRKMDTPSKQIFVLYVKGYSLNEISSKSGVKPSKIILTVHNFVKTLCKDFPTS